MPGVRSMCLPSCSTPPRRAIARTEPIIPDSIQSRKTPSVSAAEISLTYQTLVDSTLEWISLTARLASTAF